MINSKDKFTQKGISNMKLVSLFSGCGGLDLGFIKAGFSISWANEFDNTIWETYQINHKETVLDKRSVVDIPANEIPDCEGIIGGPPCQSWSEAGTQRGIEDPRGQLFFEYIRILSAKQPYFFLAENVSGILAPKHRGALNNIMGMFTASGYNVSMKMLNARNYNVPQDRNRVIIIGYRSDLGIAYNFPKESSLKPTLRDAIWDLRDSAVPAREKNYPNSNLVIPNHEYLIGGYSSIYMSRNRVRSWDEPSFTIQAGGRHAPIHPQANKMCKLDQDLFVFDKNSTGEYRRMSARECARIQTFPDEFILHYDKLEDAYKMIGNAVPVNLAYALAQGIARDLSKWKMI
jgi:DNA (cytosine-5)-methyltransferase 1